MYRAEQGRLPALPALGTHVTPAVCPWQRAQPRESSGLTRLLRGGAQNKQHSYRELPKRWAELGTVYRYERSGTMHGLFRVRGFTQVPLHTPPSPPLCSPRAAPSCCPPPTIPPRFTAMCSYRLPA